MDFLHILRHDMQQTVSGVWMLLEPCKQVLLMLLAVYRTGM